MDATGSIIAVGDPRGDSSNSGVVYMFERNPFTFAWEQRGSLAAPNAEFDDNFGRSVSLSADGENLVVGAPYEDSSGVSSDDNSISNSGAAYSY